MALNEPSTRIEERTDSFVQWHFTKGTYYNDKGQYDDNIIQASSLLLNYVKDEQMASVLDRFSELKHLIPFTENRIKLSDTAMIYLSVREKNILASQLIEMKTEYGIMRTDLIKYLEKNMAKEGLMKARITRLQLKELPLTLKGGFRDAEPVAGEETDDDDGEEIELG